MVGDDVEVCQETSCLKFEQLVGPRILITGKS